MGVLDKILGAKRAELPALRARRLPVPPTDVRPLDLRRDPLRGLRILTEIKKRSPSAGPLSTALCVAERAKAYERAGAAMISVLCDGPFFDGSFDDLGIAFANTSIPLLCKEFVIDEVQLDCARAHGASAVLLIVRCLEQPLLERLCSAARERDLVPLVEIAGKEEASRALDAGASLIGVNARDLDTLAMDASRAAEVIGHLPKHITKLHLSGLAKPEDVRRIAESSADGALVGEALMRQDDPEPLLRSLVAAAQSAQSQQK